MNVCNYCNQKFTGKLNVHVNTCSYYPIKCIDCNLEIKRNDLKNHELNECPKTIIKCKFVSCNISLERSKMVYHSVEHLDSYVMEQTIKIKESDKKYNELLEKYNKLEIQLELNTKNINNNSTFITQLHSKSIYKNKWVIYNYLEESSMYDHKEFISSDNFKIYYPTKLEFSLSIFPKGVSGSPGHLSIFLHCEDDYFFAEIKYSFQIINIKDHSLTIKGTDSDVFDNDDECGYGFTKFIQSKQLTKERSYLDKQGNLTIHFDIDVIKITLKPLDIVEESYE